MEEQQYTEGDEVRLKSLLPDQASADPLPARVVEYLGTPDGAEEQYLVEITAAPYKGTRLQFGASNLTK